jgi:hypothetical protein
VEILASAPAAAPNLDRRRISCARRGELPGPDGNPIEKNRQSSVT